MATRTGAWRGITTTRLGIAWWVVVHLVFGLVTGLYPLARRWG